MNRIAKSFLLAVAVSVAGGAALADQVPTAAAIQAELGLTKEVKSAPGIFSFKSSDSSSAFTSALTALVSTAGVGVSGIETAFESFSNTLTYVPSATTYVRTTNGLFQLAFGVNTVSFAGQVLTTPTTVTVVSNEHSSFSSDPQTLGAPGPIAGAGLPALVALLGSAWAVRRRKSA
jgi:hypothetical protein